MDFIWCVRHYIHVSDMTPPVRKCNREFFFLNIKENIILGGVQNSKMIILFFTPYLPKKKKQQNLCFYIQ